MNETLNIALIDDFQGSFENLCLRILHEGYEFMLSNGRYQSDWAEESLTAHYYWCLQQINLRIEWQVSIHCEVRQYGEDHIFEGFSAKSAPRIDMELSRWESKTELFFRVEAKIFFENDKIRPNGTKVKATDGHKRYIETGIEHFLSGHYPLPGCLIGYVVEGDSHKILSSINNLIVSNGLSPRVGVIEQESPPLYSELYFSTNQSTSGDTLLRHFMLKL